MLIIRLNYISVLKMSVTRPKYYIGTCRGKGECNSPLRDFGWNQSVPGHQISRKQWRNL